MANLPDFLQLSPDDVKREKERQKRLMQEFNSRARQTVSEMEAARALVIESDLREALKGTKGEERRRVKNQLAECLAQQGRFLEASRTASGREAKVFYEKAADAVFNRIECGCPPKVESVEGVRIQLPKFRVIKEIYSIKAQSFGYLAECSVCGHWCFLTQNPLPAQNIENFDIEKTPNDLERLKI
jgi:hypothetical protein